MPGHPGGIWRGSQGPPSPLHVLGKASDGGACRGVIRSTLLWGGRHDTGVPTVTHHLQCGGGHSGTPLGGTGSGGNGGGHH